MPAKVTRVKGGYSKPGTHRMPSGHMMSDAAMKKQMGVDKPKAKKRG